MDAFEMIEHVDGPESFLRFARVLLADREEEIGQPIVPYGLGVNGWENDTVEGFLGAAIAWGEVTQMGATQGLTGSSPWKVFATFLWCGKICE